MQKKQIGDGKNQKHQADKICTRWEAKTNVYIMIAYVFVIQLLRKSILNSFTLYKMIHHG